MEGVLWKWTNYWNGWQPRWFLLKEGVLAYYKSCGEVSQGCKGSVRVSACEITVNQADVLRIDLAVPGEQYFYLRASTSQEKQQWLVALGSAKACVHPQANGETGVSLPIPERDPLRSKRSELRLYCELLMQQVHSIKDASRQRPNVDIEKMDASTLLLGATCDTFISTLEDCLRLARVEFAHQSPSVLHQLEKVQGGYHGEENATITSTASSNKRQVQH